MKKLLFTAALAVAAFTSNAQWNEFNNTTTCDLRIRTVCINEALCSVVSTGTWVPLPAATLSIPIPGIATCAGVTVGGYEIDYAPSTGCSGNSIVFSSNGLNPCSWNPSTGSIATISGSIAPCSNCSNPPEKRIQFNYNHDMVTTNFFDAH